MAFGASLVLRGGTLEGGPELSFGIRPAIESDPTSHSRRRSMCFASLSADGKGREGDGRRLGEVQQPGGRLWFRFDSSFHSAKLFEFAGASAGPEASAVNGAVAIGVAGGVSAVDGAATIDVTISQIIFLAVRWCLSVVSARAMLLRR